MVATLCCCAPARAQGWLPPLAAIARGLDPVFGDDFDTTTINRRVIDIPGGYLAFEQTDSSSRGGSNRAWTWTLVTDDGALHDLAAGS